MLLMPRRRDHQLVWEWACRGLDLGGTEGKKVISWILVIFIIYVAHLAYHESLLSIMCDVVGHDALWTGLVCSQLTKSLSLAELQPFGEDRSVGIAGCPCPIASGYMRILPLFLTYEPASVTMLRKPRRTCIRDNVTEAKTMISETPQRDLVAHESRSPKVRCTKRKARRTFRDYWNTGELTDQIWEIVASIFLDSSRCPG